MLFENVEGLLNDLLFQVDNQAHADLTTMIFLLSDEFPVGKVRDLAEKSKHLSGALKIIDTIQVLRKLVTLPSKFMLLFCRPSWLTFRITTKMIRLYSKT